MRSTPERSPARRLLWWFDTPKGLVLMFVVGLGIRLLIAPHVGFYGDIRFFNYWAIGLREVGIRHFYGLVGDTTYVYPPGYLYILTLLGHISHSPDYLLLKLPAMLGDLAIVWIGGIFAVRLAPEEMRERVPVRAAVAAAVLFNPAVIALGAGWGQVDALPATFVLASLLLLLTGRQTMRREIGAAMLFAVAFSMKPQSSFVLPVLVYALYRHHLHRRSPAETARGLVRVGVAGVAGAVLWAVSGLPFGLNPHQLLDFYSKASNGYKTTSVWAFNLWGIIGFQRADVRNAPPITQFVLGFPAFDVGLVAFVAATVYILWRSHRSLNRGHDEGRILLAAAAMTSLAAFTLLTRMHERYLFPVIACLAPLVLWRGFRRIYAVVSVLFVLNLWYPYAVYNRSWPGVASLQFKPWYAWAFGNIDVTDTWQKKMWSVFMVAACAVLVARGFRWAERVDRTGVVEELPELVEAGAIA